jgi:uroporphyrinogen decarboxylase
MAGTDMTGPSENRFVKTLRRTPTDRVPIFEHVIDERFVNHAIGLNQRSLDLPAEPFARLARYMHMDIMTMGYRSRVPGTRTREDLASMRLAGHAEFLRRVDDFLRMQKETGLGVNVYVHGPFDSTYLSMGYETFFLNLMDDMGFIEEMMDVFTEDAVVMVKALIARGVTTIELVDDIAYAKGLFISPDIFRRLWVKRMERIIEPIHASNTPVFFHSDGDATQFIGMVLDLGFLGLNPVEPQCNDIVALKREYGKRLTLMGNLEIGGVLASGTCDDVRREMRRLLEQMMPGYGYVAMSSNSLANCVVPENYVAMVETVLEFGNY